MIFPRSVTKWISQRPFECRACKEAGQPDEPKDLYEVSGEGTGRRTLLFLCVHCDSMALATLNIPSESRLPRRSSWGIPDDEADMIGQAIVLEALCVVADEELRQAVEGLRQTKGEPREEEGLT